MNSAELPSDLSVHVAPLRIGSTSEDDKQRLASGSFPIVLYKQKCVPHAIVEVFVVLYFVARAGIATRLRDGRPGFDSPQEQGLFLFVTAFRQALGHTQPPLLWLPELLPRRVKVTTYLQLAPRLRMHGSAPQLPHMSSWRGTLLSQGQLHLLGCCAV